MRKCGIHGPGNALKVHMTLRRKGHGFEIDYYCLGALLYELLIGLPPYYSRNQNELFSNIINK